MQREKYIEGYKLKKMHKKVNKNDKQNNLYGGN